MARTITVYATNSCGYCVMLKKYLDDNKFPYQVKMVDENQQFAQEMVSKSGQMGVPFTVVKTNDGKETGILGFNVPALQQALLS